MGIIIKDYPQISMLLESIRKGTKYLAQKTNLKGILFSITDEFTAQRQHIIIQLFRT